MLIYHAGAPTPIISGQVDWFHFHYLCNSVESVSTSLIVEQVGDKVPSILQWKMKWILLYVFVVKRRLRVLSTSIDIDSFFGCLQSR